MFGDGGSTADLARLAVPLVGALEETGDRWVPFRLTDPAGTVVEPVSAFFGDLQAAGRSEATLRSYGMDLLRWFRFLWAIKVPWAQVTRGEARDFCRWMLVTGKPGSSAAAQSGAGGCSERDAIRAVGAGALRDGAALFL